MDASAPEPRDQAPAPPEGPQAFFAEFLDDYFAECDEHLTLLRRTLLALEGQVGRPGGDRGTTEGLLRSLHTLKGLSGMVGMREAERLVHAVEEYARTLRGAEALLSREGLSALAASIRLLEQVLAARRAERPLPETGPMLARLAALGAGPPPAAAPPGPKDAGSPPPPDVRTWRYRFAPSVELAARGISVATVRSRLQKLGEILGASPEVTDEGGVAFEFLVAVRTGEPAADPPGDWPEEGLTRTGEAATPPPQAAEAAEPLGPPLLAAGLLPGNVARVDLGRLDELLRMVGDLVISRARLEERLRRIEPLLPAAEHRDLQEVGLTLERQLRELRGGVMRIRMVPVGEAFERMQFAVRDLARESGKLVRLELAGQGTEIDKQVVDRVLDPLLHLVRNAVSHGLEPPEERTARGKPAEGRLLLRAATEGDAVLIEVEDDGRGMDPAAIRARAEALGLAEASQVGPDELLEILCAPGFSTRTAADRASGRGVGLAAARRAVEGLRGTLSLETGPGRGARFTIRLPLTLAILDAFIVAAGGQTFALPHAAVREVIELDPAALTSVAGGEILPYRGGVLPLLRLARHFGLPEAPSARGRALVVGSGGAATGLGVDRVLGKREIVVRPLTDPLVQSPGITGATELGDGQAVLILDAAGLAHPGSRRGRAGSA